MSDTTVYTDFRLRANHLAETGERSPAETAVRRDLDSGIEWPALLRRLERAAGSAFAQ